MYQSECLVCGGGSCDHRNLKYTKCVRDMRGAHGLLWKKMFFCVCVHACVSVRARVRVWMSQCVSVSVWSGFGFLSLCTAWCCCYDLHFNECLLKNNKRTYKKEIVFCPQVFSVLGFLHIHAHNIHKKQTHARTSHKINVLSQTKRHILMSVIFYMSTAPADLLPPLSVILIFL